MNTSFSLVIVERDRYDWLPLYEASTVTFKKLSEKIKNVDIKPLTENKYDYKNDMSIKDKRK